MTSPCDEAQEFLLGRLNYERTPAVSYGPRKFKLDRMRELLRRLGDPHERLPVVHIAGTKGKGSTAAMIAAILSAAGYRTGLYTSPHLDRIEERMMIDGRTCSVEEFCELVNAVRPVAEAMDAECGVSRDESSHSAVCLGRSGGDVHPIGQLPTPLRPSHPPKIPPRGPTFFELTTAMALLHFAQQGVDVVVLEVGLGGRLDSTNVCHPRVAVITNISFDHTRQLGNTLAKIARQKAGIIKPGVPVVTGVTEPEPLREIEQVAAAQGSALRRLGVDFDFRYRPPRDVQDRESRGQMDFWEVRSAECGVRSDAKTHLIGTWHSALRTPHSALELGLLGRHQAANAAVALATISELQSQGWKIDVEAARRGLAEVRWPARVEVLHRHPTLVLDAAHNLASIRALLATLEESFSAQRRVLVFGATSEKDVQAMLVELLPRFDRVLLTRYVNNPRGVPPEELDRLASDFATPRVICPDPAAAWGEARHAVGPDDLLCITGSFFLAAEMRAEIIKRPLMPSPVLAAGGTPRA